MKLRLLSIGHSYCVGLNRALPHWIAVVGGDQWEVVAAAPAGFHGDLSTIKTEVGADEACEVRKLPAHLTWETHLFYYGLALRRLLEEKWDLIHMWEEPYVLAGGQIVWWAPKKTRLVYCTNQNIAKSYPPPFRQIERFCFRRSSGWLTMGQTTKAIQMQRGFVGKPCDVISPGVDIESFRPDVGAQRSVKQALGWNEETAPVVGYVGRFVAEKGLSILMSALDAISAPWRALFVGGGPLEGVLREWCEQHREQARVVTGISHDQVPDYMNAIDVLCVPSQTTPVWREQFGRVIIEAFACGVPVVGSDSGEIPNVVEDAGIIVGERDQPAWVSALESLLADSQERKRLGEHARELAVSRHSHPEVARQHIRFFEQILDASAAAS